MKRLSKADFEKLTRDYALYSDHLDYDALVILMHIALFFDVPDVPDASALKTRLEKHDLAIRYSGGNGKMLVRPKGRALIRDAHRYMVEAISNFY